MEKPKDWAERLANAEQLQWDFDPQGKLELVAKLKPSDAATVTARIPSRRFEEELRYIEVDMSIVN